MNQKRKVVALMIWWCEGTKPRRDKRWKNAYLYPIEVINSDYRIVKIFADFLREDLQVSNGRLRGQIQIHEGDDKDAIEKFWSEAIGVPILQFNKTIVRPKGNKPNKNKGTFKLRVYDTLLYKKLKEFLDNELREINIGV